MAFISLGKEGVVWGHQGTYGSTGLVLSTSFPIVASGEKIAVIGEAPKSGVLDMFEFPLATVAQAPANGIRCSFQAVASSVPTEPGTPPQYRDVTSGLTTGAWVVPGLMTSDGTNGGTKRTVVQGELIACVIEFVNFIASDSLIWANLTGSVDSLGFFPYGRIKQSGAWGTPAIANRPVLTLKYNDGTYEALGGAPIVSAITGTAFSSASTPDEKALLFRMPFTCKTIGCLLHADVDNTPVVRLYDTDGATVLATNSQDARASTAGHARLLTFPDEYILRANMDYYLAFRPGASNSIAYQYHVANIAHLDAMLGGRNFRYASRSNDGVWTEDTLSRLVIFPRITAIEASNNIIVQPRYVR